MESIILEKLREVIHELNYDRNIQITGETVILTDLGLSSLEMVDLIVGVENRFNIEIPDRAISGIVTVQDILNLIDGSKNKNMVTYDGCIADSFNVDDYPLPRTNQHIRRLKRYLWLSRLLWRFDISGLENIPADGRYILCPNHQSYLDCLWVWAAIGNNRVDFNKISCLAAEVFLPRKNLLAMLGGIPVDRAGNTVPSIKRCQYCINNGYTMIIHPEGTRTRDGKMHEFKGGAAKLAIDTNVPLIPVRIDGAYDIFPPHKKLPKIFRLGRRYPIKIQFGKPIVPDSKSVEELTTMLQSEVKQMGDVV